jgi:hypothetical protein
VSVVIHGYVVVHGIVGNAGAHAAEDTRVEDGHEGSGLVRGRDRAAEELLGGVSGAVELLIGIATLDDGGALERNTGEKTFGLGIAENAGNALEGGGTGGLGVASDGASSQGHVAAKSHGASLGKSLDGGHVVEDEDKVGKLKADLAAEAGTGGRDGAGGAPGAIGQSRDDETAAEASGAKEAGLEDGNDGEALGAGENRGGDDLVGTEGLFGVDEGGENATAFLALGC